MNSSMRLVAAGLILCTAAVAISRMNDWLLSNLAAGVEQASLPRLLTAEEQLELAAARERSMGEFAIAPDPMAGMTDTCRTVAEIRL